MSENLGTLQYFRDSVVLFTPQGAPGAAACSFSWNVWLIFLFYHDYSLTINERFIMWTKQLININV